MNSPMTDERLDELVAMVDSRDFPILRRYWDDEKPPFGPLGDPLSSCPSQVRHDGGVAAMEQRDLEAMVKDPLIVDMTSQDLGAVLGANAREIFERFEHYQRLACA